MARFADLSPELLRNIATYLPSWYARQFSMAVYIRYLQPWNNKRDSDDIKSFALVNRKCRDIANAVLYGETQIVVYSNQYAKNLVASPHLCTHIRNLAWVKKNCEGTEVFDEAKETKALVELLSKTVNLQSLTIHHPQVFRVLMVTAISTGRLRLPQLRLLFTSSQVAPQNLLRCCPNLKQLTMHRQFTSEEARKFVARLSRNATGVTITVKRVSIPLLQAVAKLKRLEILNIETRIPHRSPWGTLHPVEFGRRLATLLRPLQHLRTLSLGIAIGRNISMEYGDFDLQLENAIEARHAALPIAEALPYLEKISWMSVLEDDTNLHDLSGPEEGSEGSEHGPRDSREYSGTVVRDNGRVIVKFWEDMEDALQEEYGEMFPHLF